MSTPKHPKVDLVQRMKERSQQPDFLPNSILYDTRHPADTTTFSNASAPSSSQDDAPSSVLADAPTSARVDVAREPTPSQSRAPTTASTPVDTSAPAEVDVTAHNPVEPAVDHAEEGPATSQQHNISPYRRGLKRASTFISKETKKQIGRILLEDGIKEEEFVRHALNLAFQQKGLPQVAFHGTTPPKRTSIFESRDPNTRTS